MKKTLGIVAATMVVVLGTLVLIAGAPQAQKGAQQPMSFFITSVGKGDGANYGGLAGADAYFQMMATAAGPGAPNLHPYPSNPGAGAGYARDPTRSGPPDKPRGQRVPIGVAALRG